LTAGPPPQDGRSAAALRRWLCEACGLIYDEAVGDADSGIAPGTRFEDIPDDWRCPICGVGKADFRPIEPGPSGAARSAAAPGASGAGMLASQSREAVVIVGAGAAGWGVVRALRDAGYRGPLTLVTACDGTVYSKPALSVALGRDMNVDRLSEQSGTALAAELDVRLLERAWAVDLDRARRRLLTTRGSVRYRHLILATGARARRPDLQGEAASRVLAVNDLAAYATLRASFDAASLAAAAIGRKPRLLIVGAGLVGCEFANDFACAGAQVTLLEALDLPLRARLDIPTAIRLRDALTARGVSFEGGVALGAFTLPDSAASSASGLVGNLVGNLVGIAGPMHTDSDRRLVLEWSNSAGQKRRAEFDLALVAAGVEPEIRLARRAGLTVARGIVVDAQSLCTSDESVFALGDCAQVQGQLGSTIEPILRQARTIAGQIVGTPVPYDARSPVWIVKIPGLPMTIRSAPSTADQL
jgi:rubredoxin---NAD+ reductase